MKPEVANVLLVDDSNLYREGLLGLFDRWDEFLVIGEIDNGRDAVKFCRTQVPDIILMDIQMPVMDGIEATHIIVDEHPEAVVIMLTVSLDERYLFDALRAGARGYVIKNIHARQLKDRLRKVLEGDSVLSSEVTGLCMEAVKNNDRQELSNEAREQTRFLSEREKEILRFVASGESNKEIGDRLFVSESTIKKQISTVLLKLGIKNRVQAAVFAIHAGLAD